MRRILAGAVLLLALSACATLNSARGHTPLQTWISHKAVDQLATCMIPIMNKKGMHSFPGDPDVRHVLQTTMPGKTYEIQPQQVISEGAEPYFVVLTRLDAGTKVETFAISSFASRVSGLRVCD